MANIDAVLKALNKKYGEGTIVRASEAKALEVGRIPTGSLSLDIITGGGIPENRLTLVTGGYSSGKTSVVLKIVGNAQRLFKERHEEQKTRGLNIPTKKCIWIDAEGAFDEEWARHLGVDTEELIVVRPEYGEQALDIADVLVKNDDCGMVVLDSIAGLVPKSESEESMEKLFMGDLAKMMNKFFRKLSSGMNKRDITDEDDKAPTVIMINQYREKIGVMYGNPATLPGGKGQEYSASVILELKRGDWIEYIFEKNGVKVEEVVGQWIRAFGVKNKTAPPKRTGQVRFFFDDMNQYRKGSYDGIEEIVRYGIYYGFIERRGSYYYVDGVEENFQGQAKLLEYLSSKEEYISTLKEKILNLVFTKRMPLMDEIEETNEIILDEVKTETLEE